MYIDRGNDLGDGEPSLEEDLAIELPHRGQWGQILPRVIGYEPTTLLAGLSEVLRRDTEET